MQFFPQMGLQILLRDHIGTMGERIDHFTAAVK